MRIPRNYTALLRKVTDVGTMQRALKLQLQHTSSLPEHTSCPVMRTRNRKRASRKLDLRVAEEGKASAT